MPLNKIKLDSIPDGEIAAVKLHQSGATDGQAMVWSNGNGQWEPLTISGGGDVVDDITPQLGGNLDVNGKSITASSGSIDFEINNHKSFVINNSSIKIDADNNYSAGLQFIRDKATPANGDVLAYMFAQGRDSGNSLQSFARIDLNSEIVTAGAERGSILLRNVVGSTYQDFFKADANLMQNIFYKDLKIETGVNLVFEGTLDDSNETTLAVVNPTADRTITLPDADGTIMVRDAAGVVSGGSQYGEMELQGSNPRLRLVDGDSGSNFQIYNSASSADDTYNITVDYGNTTANSALKIEVDGTDIAIFNTGGINLSNTNLGGDPASDNGNLVISHGATGQPMASIEAGATNNIAIGNQNLTSNATGDSNIAIGKLNLAANDGSNNLAIGNGVLQYGTGHNQNTLLGIYNSPQSGATGWYRNTYVGYGGGWTNQSGDYNTSIGAYARAYYNNTSYSTSLGYAAIPGHFHSTAIGTYTGASQNTQSDYCTFVGSYAGYDMDGGDRATYVGYRAGYGGGSGTYNTAVGVNSMYDITSGERNTAIGDSAGYNIESGSHNTHIGQAAGYDLTTGSQNTLIGSSAGNSGTNDLVSGSNNIIIGYQAQATSSIMSNSIVLGNASISSLQCNVQSISALSDERDKTDIQDLTLGLDFIKAMRPVQFTWNRRDGTLGTRKEVGFVAQELQEVEMDFNTKDRTHMVNDDDPSKLLAAPMQSYPILIKAIQELSAKVDSLQAEVNTLKNGG